MVGKWLLRVLGLILVVWGVQALAQLVFGGAGFIYVLIFAIFTSGYLADEWRRKDAERKQAQR